MADSGVVVEAWEKGAALRVKVHPGARRDRLAGAHDGQLKIEVTAAPEGGKANRAVIELLAKAFKLPRGAVEVLSGPASRQKRVGLTGVSPEEAAARLEKALPL